MKKLLSILGAVGLVATASTSVVACGSKHNSNNANYGYKDFQTWVNESDKNNINEIIFVGGRKDADSLSFLAARQEVTGKPANTSDISKITDNSSKAADVDFNNWLEADTSNAASSIQDTSNNAETYINFDEAPAEEAALVKNYFWDNPNNDSVTPSGIKLHSVLVDDLDSFFDNGLGKDIIDKFINNQIEQIQKFSYSGDWDENPWKIRNLTDKQKKKQVEAIKKSIATSLKNNKGPYFLVISKGKLAGITSGFKNYTQFNSKAGATKDSNKLTQANASADIAALFTSFGDNVWKALYSWLQNNWFPGKTANDNFIYNNANISDWKSQGAQVGTHTSYNPPKKDDSSDSSSSKDNSGSDSKDNTNNSKDTTFAVDLNKYIN